MTNSANGEWLRLSLYVSCTAVAATFLSGKLLAQAVERPDWSIELVDPKVLRVCADPHNMPFSTDRGEGFENKLAELMADKLGKGLSYSWYPQATGFVRNTLAAHKCDVIMGVPQGDDLVQVTNPYYRTAYALVFKQGHDLEGVDTLGGPRLAYRIAMGVRYADQEWKRELNRTIGENQPAINKLLLSFGVPLLDDSDRAITEDSIPK